LKGRGFSRAVSASNQSRLQPLGDVFFKLTHHVFLSHYPKLCAFFRVATGSEVDSCRIDAIRLFVEGVAGNVTQWAVLARGKRNNPGFLGGMFRKAVLGWLPQGGRPQEAFYDGFSTGYPGWKCRFGFLAG